MVKSGETGEIKKKEKRKKEEGKKENRSRQKEHAVGMIWKGKRNKGSVLACQLFPHKSFVFLLFTSFFLCARVCQK